MEKIHFCWNYLCSQGHSSNTCKKACTHINTWIEEEEMLKQLIIDHCLDAVRSILTEINFSLIGRK